MPSQIMPAPAHIGRDGSQHYLRFPGSSELPQLAPWWGAVLQGVAGAVMIIVSLGAMAAQMGSYSLWVWTVTAAMGGVQCIIIADLVKRFHFRAGGTPQFAFGITPNGSRTLGALSAWCYWFAWTPGIAVNLIIASVYIQRMIWPGTDVLVLALCLGAALYIFTLLGLRLTLLLNMILAFVAIMVVVSIILAPVIRPGHFAVPNVFPAHFPKGIHYDTIGFLGVFLKWSFVATWTAYAPELASSLCSEVRDPVRNVKRIMWSSASICAVAFFAVPLALFGLFGSRGLQDDPFIVFSAAGNVILGKSGQVIVGVSLIIVLILGAEALIIASSRTIYQMARDGYLPQVFSRINKNGTPIGSISWDALIILTCMLIFGTGVVNQVAAANYGYLIVFVLLPLSYLTIRRRDTRTAGATARYRWMTFLAIALTILNGVILVVGGVQWGWRVVLVGLIGSLLILPVTLFTRRKPMSSSAQ